MKKKLVIFFSLTVFSFFIYIYSYYNKYNIFLFKNFINDCINLKTYNTFSIINKNYTLLSICLPVYNMEKYIERALLSLINQSFQNFEIIIVNDNSNDSTLKIIKRLQLKFQKIKIINHYKNLGVYRSRIDAVLNSNCEYVLFMDPDDMILNPNLFEDLYKFNLKYNLDMIEFSVYQKKEGKNRIYFPSFHEFNHYHNLNKKIIYQPELSNILFYIPNTKNYTSLFCRTIWNKLIRKKPLLINTIKYTEKFFHNNYLIAADDTPINILNFNYANNYSNINVPGYLYFIRKNSMSRIENGNKYDIIVSYNYLLYYKLFYNYIKDFKKDLNFFFYDLKVFYIFFLKFKKLNATVYINKTINFCFEIIKEDLPLNFKNFIQKIIVQLEK